MLQQIENSDSTSRDVGTLRPSERSHVPRWSPMYDKWLQQLAHISPRAPVRVNNIMFWFFFSLQGARLYQTLAKLQKACWRLWAREASSATHVRRCCQEGDCWTVVQAPAAGCQNFYLFVCSCFNRILLKVELFTALLRCLHHLVSDLPNCPLGRTISDTYEFCLSGKVKKCFFLLLIYCMIWFLTAILKLETTKLTI